ncbi:helix-turn-helix transcriptional regulator [Agaribacterium haliotis]|uniref:helix-turn-helix transcriptional regulator n=1 Tax=Agaribacterium haliotis TaxID=2013869 RepID=UPI000BB57291|nr:helix-turn-helix domain-containing protein [Agaribacterium haliotis]
MIIDKNWQWQDVLEIGPECNERFLDADKVPELRELAIPLCGFSHLEGHYRVGRSKPVANTILYSVDGAIELYTPEGCQTVGKSQLIILPAHRPFLIELKAPFWTMTWFDFEDTPRWSELCTGKAPAEFCQSGRQIFHALAVLYYERDASLRRPTLDYLEHYLQESLKAPANQNQESQRLDQLFRDIDKRLHYPWSVEEMSQLIHYSAPHLHRLCQKRFGRSPLQQIIHMRMERAKYLLSSTAWPLSQIAEQVGYHDLFSFSKRFKKSVGEAPAHYRKSQNANK